MLTVFTQDEHFTLRFDTKLEFNEWNDTLTSLWASKYTPEEVKTKAKFRVVLYFSLFLFFVFSFQVLLLI